MYPSNSNDTSPSKHNPPVFTDYDNNTPHIPIPPATTNTLASLDTSIPP